MARPGRKPTNPRRLDVKFEFDTDAEGQLVRDLGGGPWIMELIQEALGKHPQPSITAELQRRNGDLEILVRVPGEQIAAARKPRR